MSEPVEPDDHRLYGLMEVAEAQQAAVQKALEGLAAERAALQRERETLARQARALEQGVGMAVRAAVAGSLAGAATEGVAAVHAATGPLLGRLAKVATEAGQAEAALRRVVWWARWRLFSWVAGTGAALMLLGWLASGLVLWWDTGAIAAARNAKARLEAEVATLQDTHDDWIKAGMLGKLERCIPGNRPCIRVDESAGAFGTQSDYRVLQGY